MTGLEPKAIAGAVEAGKALVKAGEEDSKDRDALRQLAEAAGELEPAARAYAKRLMVKQHLWLKIWQPIGRLIGFSHEFFENAFEDEMADRLRDVPEEDLVTPKGSVAGPALQGLGFVVEEPELRAMYLNLLAAASDKRVEQSAHPSFADVIKQLTAVEAGALAGVLGAAGGMHPIVEIRCRAATPDVPDAPGFTVLATHVMNWAQGGRQVAAPERSLFVDNWVRQGLVTVTYDFQSFTDEARYAWVDTCPPIVEAREHLDTQEFKRVEIQHGVLKATDFGRAFYRVVIAPPTEEMKATTAQ